MKQEYIKPILRTHQLACHDILAGSPLLLKGNDTPAIKDDNQTNYGQLSKSGFGTWNDNDEEDY